MIKWKLMLTTLPFVAVAIGVKLFLRQVLRFEGVIDFSDVGLVLTAGVFLIGFMLAGVMADYKESEKIPADLACTLETIEETFAQAKVAKPEINLGASNAALSYLATGIRDWFYKRITQEELFARLSATSAAIRNIERAGAGSYAGRALSELHNLRKTLTRTAVISRTSFLSSGYALLETLIGTITVLLMVCRFKNPVAELILVAFITLVYVYMLRLIIDVDDPFDYADGRAKGAAEVELFPLEEYIARAASRPL